MKIIPTILCGGSGTRLWPLSRSKAPKQLQALTNDKSLLANTLLRLNSYSDALEPVIICGLSYVDEIEAQMVEEGVSVSAFITEPKGRDTAAAAAIAAHWGARIQANDPDEDYIVLLLPADHHISDVTAFHQAINLAAITALEGWIATIGITPDAPETGFGYINRELKPLTGLASYKVARFVEKPDLQTAKSYLDSGDYLWNAGMFAFRPSTFIEELQKFEPEIAANSLAAFNATTVQRQGDTAARLDLPSQEFLNIPALSVDYAVMEKTKKASVLPAEFGWNDVGSWAAVFDISTKDNDGNVIQGEAITVQTKNTYIRGGTKLITTAGVSDLIIVDTDNALMICTPDQSQLVKSIHKELEARGSDAAQHHGAGTKAHKKLVTETARNWLFDKAYPFWSTTGLDNEFGGVYEAVDFQGRPLKDLPKRIRVQARQAYVFAHGHALGVPDLSRPLEHALDFLLNKGQVDTGRFAHQLAPNGEVLDNQADSYDHAFILFALAWAYKVTADPKLLKTAEEVLSFLKTEMRHELQGFREALPECGATRRANPHMHLFEASLAWADLHQHDEMTDLAHEIFTLFESHFAVNGLVREYFEDDLSPLKNSSSPDGFAVEPGHLYEWCFLLQKYEKLTGTRTEIPSIMDAFADRYGHNPDNGLVLDKIFPNGEHVQSQSMRLWPQTEFIRWKMLSSGQTDQVVAYQMIERLFEKYLVFDGATPGFWRDCLDIHGKDLIHRAPASSMYHILGCIEPLV